jgi:DNA-binding response OmpR family regulator
MEIDMVLSALIVEDELGWQDIIRESLESVDIQVDVGKNRAEAKQLSTAKHYDLVIIDIHLDKWQDEERTELDTDRVQTANLLFFLKHRGPNTKYIILTAYGTLEFAINAFRKLGVSDFFIKDTFDVAEFVMKVKEILKIDQNKAVSITKTFPTSSDSLLAIELENRKGDLIKKANASRKESDEYLLTIKSKRITARGGQSDSTDEEWVSEQRKLLDERYRIALSKINKIDSLEEVIPLQLWLEKEYNDWLGISAQ